MTATLRQPELMSPAGGWPQLHAAIEAGADAVYFGLTHFSARAKVGFETHDLPEVLRTLHRRGVKGFVTFNTLVFDEELAQAESAIVKIASAGADAIIVQDIGIAQLCQQIAPTLPIHGSTQMSVTSSQGVHLAAQFGCSRVVLARELSLKDIEKIAVDSPIELETFVHGALCVSYSGQCFSSEAWGGRSANRGQCAQACRLSYDLIVDGASHDTENARYLLSPGDLFALRQVPELIRLGVACLKIEGRYKDEYYVAATTAAYRRAIDESISSPSNQPTMSGQAPPLTKRQLDQIYSRGSGPYFIDGVDHQGVVKGRAPRHRGVFVGTVSSIETGQIIADPVLPIQPGDGLVFDAANWRSPDEPEEGGHVFEVKNHRDGKVELRFETNKISLKRIRVGDKIWRTSDPQLIKSLKPLASGKKIFQTMPIQMVVRGEIGSPLEVTARIESPFHKHPLIVKRSSRDSLQIARGQSLTTTQLREQLGRLGGTPFHLLGLENELTVPPHEGLFLPLSVLNELRREIATALEELLVDRGARPSDQIHQGQLENLLSSLGATANLDCREADSPAHSPVPRFQRSSREEYRNTANLHVLVRTREQLGAAIELNPASITLDFLELYGLRPAVKQIVAAKIQPRVASPRILKPAEQNVVRFLTSLTCPILVRSGGLLFDLLKLPESRRPELIGDFSLNAANVLSMNTFLKRGCRRVTPSHDLNAAQIRRLTSSTPADQIEVVVFHHMPVFHTEHCVFCRFLSDGTDHTNCGHPCESHRVAVRDQSGRVHPVMADVGCRNTIFGAEGQSAIGHLAAWRSVGLRNFRLEFAHEAADQVQGIFSVFSDFLSRRVNQREAKRRLNDQIPSGTTEGSFFVPRDSLVQLK